MNIANSLNNSTRFVTPARLIALVLLVATLFSIASHSQHNEFEAAGVEHMQCQFCQSSLYLPKLTLTAKPVSPIVSYFYQVSLFTQVVVEVSFQSPLLRAPPF